MNTTKDVAVRSAAAGALITYSPEEIETIKASHFKGLEPHQISYALKKAERMGLDFFTGDVVCWPGNEGKVEVYTTISGLRGKAEETGIYFPGRAPTFEHGDNGEIVSCTAYVKRWDDREGKYGEIEGVAFWAESAKNKGAWTTHKHAMLAKCAEAAALRRAFPAALHGLHIAEERDTADDQDSRKAVDRDAGRAAVVNKLKAVPTPAAATPIKAVPVEKVEPPAPAAAPPPQEAELPVVECELVDDAGQPLQDPAGEAETPAILDQVTALVAKLSMPKRIVLFKSLGMATNVDLTALSPDTLGKIHAKAVELNG